MTRHLILLVGATGVFGGRLARQLAAFPDITVVVTSRDRSRAEALATKLREGGAVAEITALAFDNRADLPKLASTAPWLVIDASGPFQNGDYSLARASLEAGANYIDLADARSHVLGFSSALDGLAQERGLVALTGASSTPALSGAVVESLTAGWKRIDGIEAAIAPGGASEVGLSVIEAILSYAGRPIPVWRGGRLDNVVGWGMAERWVVPGLGQRLVSPVETPDAEMLSGRFDVKDRVRFLAGLESKAEHFGMLALARAFRGIPRPKTVAKILHGVRRFTRPFCGDRGGMVVQVAGLNSGGEPVRAQWSLIAENDDGPYVPTLAAVASVRALLGGMIAAGARPCVGVVSLSEIEKEMANFAITTRRECAIIAGAPLFRDILGDSAYDALPQALRDFHASTAAPVWTGVSDVDVGISLPARFLSRLFGLPEQGRGIPVTVIVEREEGAETWTRVFGLRRFRTRLRKSAPGVADESIGPFAFDLGLEARASAVHMPVVGWRLFGLPMPPFLAPISVAREFEDEAGRYRFDVRLSAPIVGLLAHYSGWLLAGDADAGEPGRRIPATALRETAVGR